MYESLNRTLVSICACYTELSEIGSTIYSLLKKKKLKDIHPFNTQQLQKMEHLKELKQSLEQLLKKYCAQQNINEIKIRSLLPYFSKQEQEAILRLLDEIKCSEAAARKTLLQNQYYIHVLLQTTENMVDLISDLNMEKNNNSQLFMNELL